MYIKSEEMMFKGVLEYAREFKKYEGKTQEQIELEMDLLADKPMNTLKALQELITDVREHVDLIYAPTFVVQGRHDDVINPKSADIIIDSIESPVKKIKWYEESGHVITLDKEKDELHEDVLEFLESLDWSE
jgi:carboxylesterase